MKKLVLVLAMLMVLPAAAFGIQYDLMNDGNMDEVTGQSGVSIAMDDIQLFLNIERLAWIDCDGYTCEGDAETSNGGAIGIQNFQIDVLTINAIVNTADRDTGDGNTNGYDLASSECGEIDLIWDYDDTTTGSGTCMIATGYYGALGTDSGFGSLGTQTLGLNNYGLGGDLGTAFVPKALTIDATSQLPVLSEIYDNNGDIDMDDDEGMGGVIIGLPTIEVYIPDMTMTPAFYNVESSHGEADHAEAWNDAKSGADYGTIQMSGITFSVLSGWIEIAPH